MAARKKNVATEVVDEAKKNYFAELDEELAKADAEVDPEIADVIEMTRKELKQYALNLGLNEMAEIVKMYYQIQRERVRATLRIKAGLRNGNPPYTFLTYMESKLKNAENQVKYVLSQAIKQYRISDWLMSILGIGPIITAGLIANLDPVKAKTYGGFERFAGIDPTAEWKEGQKRPWNATLKTLLWKAGESFVKTQNKPADIYGQFYKSKKAEYIKRNEEGGFAETAAKQLSLPAGKGRPGKDTKEYAANQKGMLSDGHIHSMAKRYAEKVFLDDLFYVWYELQTGQKPPLPYTIAFMGHAHPRTAPNRHVVGLPPEQLYREKV